MTAQGKIVIVAGAMSDIGHATANLLHQKGATVVLAGRRLEDLRKLEGDLAGSLGILADVTVPEDAMRLVQQTQDELGRIDGLIYCLGLPVKLPVADTDSQAYRELLELNAVAPLNLMHLVVPIMRKQGGGSIVNVSSLHCRVFTPGFGAYASAKSALTALSLTARKELAADRIAVSLVFAGVPDAESEPKPNQAARVATAIVGTLESGAAEMEVAA